MAAIDLSNLGNREDVQEPLQVDEDAVESVQWAFIVYKTYAGETIMHHDINIPVVPDRSPHMDDVHGACANVMSDINTMKTAGHTAQTTVNGLMQLQQEAMQQAQAQAIQQQMQKQKMVGKY